MTTARDFKPSTTAGVWTCPPSAQAARTEPGQQSASPTFLVWPPFVACFFILEDAVATKKAAPPPLLTKWLAMMEDPEGKNTFGVGGKVLSSSSLLRGVWD